MAPPPPSPNCLPIAGKAREKREAGQTFDNAKGSVSKLLSADWKAMSPEQKAPFMQEAQQQK